MMFNEFFEVLKSNNFDEIPVDAKTFVESPDYLGQPPLSDIQYDIVEAMSQIYKLEDLIEIMGDTEGRRYYKKYTKNEVILQLGKGSGKDFTSTVACAYIVFHIVFVAHCCQNIFGSSLNLLDIDQYLASYVP